MSRIVCSLLTSFTVAVPEREIVVSTISSSILGSLYPSNAIMCRSLDTRSAQTRQGASEALAL